MLHRKFHKIQLSSLPWYPRENPVTADLGQIRELADRVFVWLTLCDYRYSNTPLLQSDKELPEFLYVVTTEMIDILKERIQCLYTTYPSICYF